MKSKKRVRKPRPPAIKKSPWKGAGQFLFEFTFNSGHRVHVTTNGVTIWDAPDGRWIIDASTIARDNSFAIGSEIFKRASTLLMNPKFPGSYLRSKPKARKRVSRKESADD